MPIKEDLQALSEAEANVKAHWEKVLEYIKAKGSPVFIWEVRATHLKFIHDDIQRGIHLVISLHSFVMYNYGSRSYQKFFEKTRDNLTSFRFHLENIDGTEEWIKQSQTYINEICPDIKKIGKIAQGWVSRREFLGMGLKAAAVTAIMSPVAARSVQEYLVVETSKLPKNNKEGLAILISKVNNPIEKVLANFLNIYIARIELAFGFKARYVVDNAGIDDLQRILYDSSIQSICVLGHGYFDKIELSGGYATTTDLIKWYKKRRSNKGGYFLKHSCGYLKPFMKEDDLLVFKPKIYKELKEESQNISRSLPRDFSVRANIFGDEEVYGAYIDELKIGKYSSLWGFKEVDIEILPYQIKQKVKDFNKRRNELLNNHNNISPYIFGVPFFEPNHIVNWTRINSPIDFLLNPLGTNKVIDKYSAAFHNFYKNWIIYHPPYE